MKRAIKISLIAVVTMSMAQAQETKRYEVKSAKIEYDLKSSGEMMGGMVKIKGVGKKRVIFDNYGLKEITEENKVTKNRTMGETKVEKNHTLNYMNGAVIYSVKFKHKKINRVKNPMSALAGANATKTGEDMLKKMGGKKIGVDKVAGLKCDIWDLSGVKQCIYKGVPLRVESNIMGIHSVETATKAEFGISLSKSDFKLPDFPIYNMQGKRLDKSKLEKMDAKDNAKAKTEKREGAELLKGMSAGLEEAKKVGYDPKSGKDMTPTQEEAMKKAMMNAMGGESTIFKREKQEILKEIGETIKAKDCIEGASSLADANKCVPSGEEKFDAWNSKLKKEILRDMGGFIGAKSCIESATNMAQMRKCMPQY